MCCQTGLQRSLHHSWRLTFAVITQRCHCIWRSFQPGVTYSFIQSGQLQLSNESASKARCGLQCLRSRLCCGLSAAPERCNRLPHKGATVKDGEALISTALGIVSSSISLWPPYSAVLKGSFLKWTFTCASKAECMDKVAATSGGGTGLLGIVQIVKWYPVATQEKKQMNSTSKRNNWSPLELTSKLAVSS